MIIPLNADPIPLPSTSEIATGHILHARSRHYYQYIVSRRIERAQTSLLHSDLSVTDICFSVGFESLGSFSWLFRRRVGISPEKFRHQGRS